MKVLPLTLNKLLLCFRPVVDMGNILENEATTTLAAYLDLEDEEIRTSKTAPSCRCSRNSAPDYSTVSRPPKRALSRTARAVMFGTILIKRVRERKSYHQQKSDGRKRSLSLDSGSLPLKENEEAVKRKLGGMYKENRGKKLVSLYSLPSGSGSSLSLPISISEPKISNKKTSGSGTSGVRHRDADQRSCYALNSGVGLVVVSLGVTVMQGRVIAILITSMWVYFYRWLKKKATKFTETEVTGTLRTGPHSRRAQGGRMMEQSEMALNL